MQKSGGIIALIGGIFGTIAALFTLLVGGIDAELGGGSQIAALGAMGLLFAFLTIIFGAIAMNAKSKKPGIILILCSVIGAITGGTLVAVCMVLALVGGILSTLGVKKVIQPEETSA